MLFEAIKQVGKWDAQAIIKRLEGMEYEGLSGNMIMRAEDHQLLAPMPLMEVVNDRAFSKGAYPGFKLIRMIPVAETTIPLSETGCKRKAGEF